MELATMVPDQTYGHAHVMQVGQGWHVAQILMNVQAIHAAMEHVIMALAQISGLAHAMLDGTVKLATQILMSAHRILVQMGHVHMG